jgi:hypothetical protein
MSTKSSPALASTTKEMVTQSGDEAQNDVAPLVQLQPILNARKKHGPSFRREIFDFAYALYISLDDNDAEDRVYTGQDGYKSIILRGKLHLMDIYGVEQEVCILKAGVTNEVSGETCMSKRVWAYNDIQHLGYRYGCSMQNNLLPFQFSTQDIPIKEESEPVAPDFDLRAAEWRAEWQASEFCRRLSTFFAEHARGATQYIDQIVCFGLGCPVSVVHPRTLRRSYVQHLAAGTIRDVIAQQQDGHRPKVFAQDPAYTAVDSSYLSDHFNITEIADPEGMRTLTGSSFVMTVAPNIPVRQVALDITYGDGGPVGFFCNAIDSNGLESDGQLISDVMLYTCNSSPALWEYKQKSVSMEYDDKEEMDCFGGMGVYLKRRK